MKTAEVRCELFGHKLPIGRKPKRFKFRVRNCSICKEARFYLIDLTHSYRYWNSVDLRAYLILNEIQPTKRSDFIVWVPENVVVKFNFWRRQYGLKKPE